MYEWNYVIASCGTTEPPEWTNEKQNKNRHNNFQLHV